MHRWPGPTGYRDAAGAVLGTLALCAVTAAGPSTRAQPGWVLSHQKISATEGGFTGPLHERDQFSAVTGLGDLDGDGVGDLAVGARRDDDGGKDRGAVWILFLEPDGTVRTHQKISATEGGFTGSLHNEDLFGRGLAGLGDLDGDGVGDLAVGAWRDDDGGRDRGAVWILFLEPDGTVKAQQKISDTEGGFEGALDNGDRFGAGVARLGDVDGDGVGDVAVGAPHDDDGGSNRGAVWILLLDRDGTVKSHQKISDTAGGFTGWLDHYDYFGTGLGGLDDLDDDGVRELAVGAPWDDDGCDGCGAVWLLFLDRDGTVKSHRKISATEGGFAGVLRVGDEFGRAVTELSDLDGDGTRDMAVGAIRDDDGGTDRGAVWILFLNRDGTVGTHQKISDTQGGFTGTLDDEDLFGVSVTAIGDHDGVAVGASFDDDGGRSTGAVWVLFLDGTPSCPADLDRSGDVGFGDLLRILDAWGHEGGPEDLDGSGTVDFHDLLIVLDSWGPCPGDRPGRR